MGAFYPHNPLRGQRLQSAVEGATVKEAFIAHFEAVPQTVSVTAVHADITLSAGGTATTGITNPTNPAVLEIKGTGAGATGNVVITGTDYLGAVITDTIALNGAATVEGVKAFKTVTSIQYPADSGATGEKVSVGVTKKLGLPYKLAHSTLLIARFDNAADAGTLSVDPTNISGNFYAVAGSPNSAKVLDLYLAVPAS